MLSAKLQRKASSKFVAVDGRKSEELLLQCTRIVKIHVGVSTVQCMSKVHDGRDGLRIAPRQSSYGRECSRVRRFKTLTAELVARSGPGVCSRAWSCVRFVARWCALNHDTRLLIKFVQLLLLVSTIY